MKTINIKNGLFWNGWTRFRVTINGEERIMKTQYMDIDVDENASFEIKVRRYWRYSAVYSFEPKDNLLLRILVNPQMRNRSILLGLLGAVLFWVLKGTTEIRWIIFSSYFLIVVLPAIYMIIMRKSYFVIKEAS